MKIVKRKSNLIPYRQSKNGLEFYLSHRSKTAKQYPNIWSFWGGGIEEGETPEKALEREIQEELNWKSEYCIFFGIYFDSMPNEKHIFFVKVSDDFEKEIDIHESQGGKFFSMEQIYNEADIIPEDKQTLHKLFEHLSMKQICK